VRRKLRYGTSSHAMPGACSTPNTSKAPAAGCLLSSASGSRGIVAKWKHGVYVEPSSWIKIKNRAYTGAARSPRADGQTDRAICYALARYVPTATFSISAAAPSATAPGCATASFLELRPPARIRLRIANLTPNGDSSSVSARSRFDPGLFDEPVDVLAHAFERPDVGVGSQAS